MALADMYNIVHQMTLFGRSVLNVYQAERANAGEAAATISDGFQNSVLPSIQALQNQDVINNELRIFNLGVTTDFGTFSLGDAPGFRLGPSSPSFVSGGIRFPSRDRDIRSGFKRFCGLEEDDYADGVLDGAAKTLLDNVGDALIGDWLSSIDSHIICNFVIIKRICIASDPDGKCIGGYRLPEPGDILAFYTPNSRITQPNATSQVSRKIS